MPSRPPFLPRAEALLGTALNALTAESMADLVARQVREDQSLDWKTKLYDANNWWKLAKAAAAFANASGGVVIFGIDEDDQARASALTPVPLTDENRRKLVDALVRQVAPAIPHYDILEIPDAAAAGTAPAATPIGYYCVVVQPSPVAPHAVVVGDKLFYPVREDAQTRNMREPEIAARYRDRFTELTRRTDRLSQVHSEGLERLPPGTTDVWLTMATAPEQPGRSDINPSTLRDGREWLRTRLEEHAPRQTFAVDSAASVGRKRLIFSSEYDYAGTSSEWHLELHADGAFYGAVCLGRQPIVSKLAPYPVLPVPALDCESQLLTLMTIAAGHADRTGAGGDLLLSAQIVPARDPQALWTAPGGSSYSTGGIHPGLCATSEIGEVHRIAGTFTVAKPHLIQQSTTRSISTEAVDLVAAGYQVASEMLAEFGLGQPTSLRPNGMLALDDLHGELPRQLRGWAQQHSVVTDQAAPLTRRRGQAARTALGARGATGP